jgi:nucleotide-binding universal stress UspA family protein
MLRVLVPTDFSPTSLRVIRQVRAWVEAIGGEVLLLHVVPNIDLPWLDCLATIFVDQAQRETAYEHLYAESHRKFSTWLPYPENACCRTLVVVGHTADAIVQVAQAEGVDLIVMRAPRRRRWRPMLLGSVTDSVIRRAPVPVVVCLGLEPVLLSALWMHTRDSHGGATPVPTDELGSDPAISDSC